MADVVYLRSMGATLAYAGFTCAVFAAANWDLDFDMMGSCLHGGFLSSTMHACVMPLAALGESLSNAARVWRVKASLVKARGGLAQEWSDHHLLISIITLSPIYIQTPEAAILDAMDGAGFRAASWDEIKELSPFELAPTHRSASDELAHVESAQFMYLQLPKEAVILNVRARVALLASGLLVPDRYKEVCRLRARSRFLRVISALQAGMYTLGVMWHMAQHLAISPVELIVCFFSLHILLQFLVEFYACTDFQRPLLLRLTPDQLSSLHDALTTPRLLDLTACPELYMQAFTFLAILLITLPSIFYFFHYLPSSLLSSVAVALFFLAVLFFLALVVTPLVGFMELAKFFHVKEIVVWLMFFVTLASTHRMLGCSIILVVLATILNWHAFNKAVLFASILLPHM